jgi:hypothetical protein
MLLAYIDSIEPLVASVHAQMQMKQANCVGLCFFATVVVTPLVDELQIHSCIYIEIFYDKTNMNYINEAVL